MASHLYTVFMVWLILNELTLIWFIECAPLADDRGDD